MLNKKAIVYQTIKERIVDGTLDPGFPINEIEFAKDQNVSKTPIREALRQLEREGLVVNIPGRGSAVAHITFQDIRETFELREIIECGAAKKAALVCHREEVNAKKKEIERLSAQDIELSWPVWGPEEDVHLFIIKCIGNQKLIETYLGLLDHIKRIRIHYGGKFTRERYYSLLSEHITILDALVENNPERAELEVQNHLRNAAAYLFGLTTPKKG